MTKSKQQSHWDNMTYEERKNQISRMQAGRKRASRKKKVGGQDLDVFAKAKLAHQLLVVAGGKTEVMKLVELAELVDDLDTPKPKRKAVAHA